MLIPEVILLVQGCCRPLGIPGAKKEEEEIDVVYSNNENQ
jgi:hypothetical protein